MYELTPYHQLFGERDDPQPYREIVALLEGEGAALVGPDGERVALPPQLRHALLRLARLFAAERAALIETVSRDPSSQDAARLINIPHHPEFVRLLDEGQIPATTEYTEGGYLRQRIRLEDLFTYRDERRKETKRILDELVRMAEEDGEYDVTPEEIAAFEARVGRADATRAAD